MAKNLGSNNTNKLSPQEQHKNLNMGIIRSNNTNKLSPQEPDMDIYTDTCSSNNTNKLSPQEQECDKRLKEFVQIIQINLVLKNRICGYKHCREFK